MKRRTNRGSSAALLAFAFWLAAGSRAGEAAPADAVDPVQESVWENQRALDVLEFRMGHGDAVRLERVNYPNYENQLTPAYVFTPIILDPAKKYPGLVVLHGSNHGHFGPEYFRLIRAAVEKGYAVIFPEYRGSAGYGL